MYLILRSLRDCFKSGQIAGKVGICLFLASLGALNATAQIVGYPPGAFPAAATNTGTTGAVAATMTPPNSSEFVYICGFAVSFLENATGGTTSGPVTVTGAFGGTQTYQIANVAASAAFTSFTQPFNPCLSGSAPGQAISVTTTANAQAAAVDVQVWGYRQP